MDTSKLVIVAKYSDDRGILRFTQTIKDGISEVQARGMSIIFDSDLYRNDRQVIVYAYTAQEHELGLEGYDVPVTINAGDVVPYPIAAVLAFVAAFEPTDEQQNAKRERQFLDATQRWQDEKKNYKKSWKALTNEFYKALRNRKSAHKESREKYARIMKILDPHEVKDKTVNLNSLDHKPETVDNMFKALDPTIEERFAELDNLPGFGIIPISATVSDEDIERIRREWAERNPSESGAATE